MPRRIEDVRCDIARLHYEMRTSIIDVDGNIIPSPQELSDVERARVEHEVAGGKLSQGPSAWQLIATAAKTAVLRTALEAVLRAGGPNALALRRLLSCPAFQGLDADGRDRLLRLTLLPDGPALRALFLNSLSYQDIAAPVLGKWLEIYERLPAAAHEGLSALAEAGGLQRSPMLPSTIGRDNYASKAMGLLDVFERVTDVNARASLAELGRCWYVLFDQDRDDMFFVDRLADLVNRGVDPTFAVSGVSAGDLYSSIILESCRPEEVNQSGAGTCTVTSMQYALCRQNPAEYLRIVSGLVSTSGYTALGSGQVLQRAPASIPRDATTRSPSERIFQAALMLYARGSYADTDSPTIGLDGDQEKQALEALFGENFVIRIGDWRFWEDVGENILAELRTRPRLDRAFAALHWGNGGHFVFLTELKPGRIYYRNPWGASGLAAGTALANPERRVENAAIGFESMTEQEFKKVVRSLLWPKR